jgi:hypothetical protein
VACTAKSQYEHRRVQNGTCTYNDRGRVSAAAEWRSKELCCMEINDT